MCSFNEKTYWGLSEYNTTKAEHCLLFTVQIITTSDENLKVEWKKSCVRDKLKITSPDELLVTFA